MTLAIGDTVAFGSGGRTGKATVGAIGQSAEQDLICFYVFDAQGFATDAALEQGFSGVIAHVPVNAQYAFDGLGEKLSENDPLPEAFATSHEQWKANLKAGHVGWFDKPLAAALDDIFSSMIIDGPQS